MDDFKLPRVVEFAMQKYKNLDCVGEIYSAQILWVSNAFAEKTGYTQDELLKLSPRKLLDMSPEGFIKYIVSTMSNTIAKQKLIKKDGTIVNGVAKIHSFTYENDPYVAITDVVLDG
jgi:hypothetical protein